MKTKWSKDTPDLSGYYWCKENGKDPVIVKVVIRAVDSYVIYLGTDEYDYLSVIMDNTEWYGPITLSKKFR